MLTFSDEEVAAQVREETGQRPPFALGAFSDLAEDVRRSIDRIKASPFLLHRYDVRGFIYDVNTGRLQEVDHSG